MISKRISATVMRVPYQKYTGAYINLLVVSVMFPVGLANDVVNNPYRLTKTVRIALFLSSKLKYTRI